MQQKWPAFIPYLHRGLCGRANRLCMQDTHVPNMRCDTLTYCERSMCGVSIRLSRSWIRRLSSWQSLPWGAWAKKTYIYEMKKQNKPKKFWVCTSSPYDKAGILLIRTLGTHFSDILSGIHAFSFNKMLLKMCKILCRSQCVKLHLPVA